MACGWVLLLSGTLVFATFIALLTEHSRHARSGGQAAEPPDDDPRTEMPDGPGNYRR